jgi:hypothetical protein
MWKSEYIALVALLMAPAVSAEIFKCVGKNGLDLYQNFPCQFETIGWVPNTPSAQLTSEPIASSQADNKALAREASLNGKSRFTQAQPRLGMTTEEVRAIWGEPTDALQEEPGQGSRYEVWSYGSSRSVRFDHKGRVSAIQQ